jgi:4-azaleucine resistance transporter AzlC
VDKESRSLLLAAAPLAAAIGVFGTIYGAGAGEIAPPLLVVASSALIFSGSVQFASVGLLLTGAGPASVLLTAAMLNTRNLLLGAALRPRFSGTRRDRALHAWWLTDEAAGLALTSSLPARRVLFVSGFLFYSSWVVGTALGGLGAELASLEDLAAAVFPVLFIGLAAMASRSRDGLVRCIVAALASLVVAVAVPDLRGVVPALAAVAVAVPGGKR